MATTMPRNGRKKMVADTHHRRTGPCKREDIERELREQEYAKWERSLHRDWRADPYDPSEFEYEPGDWDDEPDDDGERYE